MFSPHVSLWDILPWALVAILVSLSVPVLLFLTKNTKRARMINRVPGPPGVPILGNAWELFVPALEVIHTFFGMVARHPSESIVRFWLGYRPVIIIKKGYAAEKLLRAPEYVNKSDEYKLNYHWLRMGLLNSPREKWEKRRKMLNPSFHAQILDSFVPIYNEQIEILLKNWESKDGKGSFNAFPYVIHCTMDILCVLGFVYSATKLDAARVSVYVMTSMIQHGVLSETTMGIKLRTQENYNSEYVEALSQIFEVFATRIMRPWLHSDFLFSLTKLRQVEIDSVKVLHGLGMEMINKRRQFHEEQKKNNANEISGKLFGEKRRLATLDLMLHAEIDGKPLTDSDILEEVQIIGVAGFETTGNAIAWTLYLLGHDSEVQTRAQEEIDSILGATDRPVTLEDLPKLKYVEAIIKEGLRIFPPIPIFGRKADEDIEIDGYTIPAQTSINVMPFFVHRDPDVFPDPEKFDPERFLSDRKYTPYEYMPFCAGPRNCIGQRFAMLEMKVVLARLLKNFNFVSYDKREDIKYINGAVLHSLNGINISVKSRKC